MKKYSLIVLICLQMLGLGANPVIFPCLSEINFEEDNWFIELDVQYADYAYHGSINLDDFRLITSTGDSQFKPGIDISGVAFIIITQDSLLSPLVIDKQGDYVGLQYFDNGLWTNTLCWITYFGDIENSTVNPPYPGQSIVNTSIHTPQNWFFMTVKDNIPSLGSSIYNTSTFGTLSGAVFDQNLDPVEGLEIRYCSGLLLGGTLQPIYSGSDGTFYNSQMPGCNTEISVLWDNTSLFDTLLTIEPDSLTSCTFYLDTVLVGLPEESPIGKDNNLLPAGEYIGILEIDDAIVA
jgi:hypothetical protein